VPVIFITSVGFYFHVRSQKQVHVVESENIAGKKYYLRLHEPFEELAKYVEGKGLAKIVQGLRECQSAEEKQNWEKEFSKITYPVFLVESFKKLRQHFGRNPKPQEVKDLLK
jgi:ERCC4-related helicase